MFDRRRRQVREWLANKLANWSELLSDYSRLVRPLPLSQYGPPTSLQMLMQETREETRRKFLDQMAFINEQYPFLWSKPKLQVVKTLQIKLPQDKDSS